MLFISVLLFLFVKTRLLLTMMQLMAALAGIRKENSFELLQKLNRRHCIIVFLHAGRCFSKSFFKGTAEMRSIFKPTFK